MNAKRILWTAIIALFVSSVVEVRSNTSNGEKALVGTWIAHVMPAIGPTKVNVVTFTADGGVIQTTNAPGVSSGLGVWERTGELNYAMTFVIISQDPSLPFQRVTVRATVNLDAGGETAAGRFIEAALDPDGNVLFSDEGTIEAARINIESLE